MGWRKVLKWLDGTKEPVPQYGVLHRGSGNFKKIRPLRFPSWKTQRFLGVDGLIQELSLCAYILSFGFMLLLLDSPENST